MYDEYNNRTTIVSEQDVDKAMNLKGYYVYKTF